LVTAAHIEVIRVRIQPALASGRTVLLDRYWWSTWVYATLEGVAQLFVNTLIQLELQAWELVRPNVLFLISGPTRKTIQRANTDSSRVVDLYQDLYSRPHEFPVELVRNDGDFSIAVAQIVRAIKDSVTQSEL
jgi:dTMP kinase